MAVFITGAGIIPRVGKKAANYAVGESIFLILNDIPTEFLIVHQGNPDVNFYSSTCDGTWILSKDIFEERAWDSSGYKDYENSSIHKYLNNTSSASYNRGFIGKFDSKSRAVIKEVKIPYRPGGGKSKTVYSGENGLSTKGFLLSAAEVGIPASTSTYFPNDEGAKLDYFESGTGTSAKNKRIAMFEGNTDSWWLRTPEASTSASSEESDEAVLVTGKGSYQFYFTTTDSYGIRPALIINFTAEFNPDTNIIL